MDQQEQMEILFYEIPERFLKKTMKVEKMISRMRKASGDGSCLVWPEKRIRMLLQGYRDDGPIGTDWMHRMWKEQCRCSSLIVILPEKELMAGLAVTEQIIGTEYGYLNYFLLASDSEYEKQKDLFLQYRLVSDMYRETGLLAELVTDEKLKKTLGALKKYGKTVWIDLRPGYRVPCCDIPENTVYLDMTTDREKERMLYAKRKDIEYISLRNFLDTYGRNRYNMYRCQKV